jgi:colanic acid/amylovoran biosynthesis glycosyltransferase
MISTGSAMSITGNPVMPQRVVGHVFIEYLDKPMAYLYQEITSLRRYQSRVFCERHIDDGRFEGPEVYTLYRYRSKRSLRGLFFRALVRLTPDRLPGFIIRQLRLHPTHLLHAHFGTTALRLVQLRQRVTVPLVTTFYGRDASGELRAHPEAYRRLFAVGDMFIVQGEQIRDRLIAYGCPPEKLTVWDIGVDLSQFPYLARDTEAKQTRILTAARFIEKKGYPYLLEAFARVARQLTDARLTIIGQGPLKGEIESQINALNLNDRVTLIDTSRCDDFNAFYAEQLRSHHIFVLPSVQAADGDEDGLPIVLQNALACGLPVISTPVGGIPRAVVNGRTGYLVLPGDVDALAEKMQFLAEHRQIWNTMGGLARQHVEEHFELNAQGCKVEAIYDRLLASQVQ